MNNHLARFLYWQSLGIDPSEWPIAKIIEQERKERLRSRIGDEAFKQWSSYKERDPMRYSIAGAPLVLLSLPILAGIFVVFPWLTIGMVGSLIAVGIIAFKLFTPTKNSAFNEWYIAEWVKLKNSRRKFNGFIVKLKQKEDKKIFDQFKRENR